MNHEWRRRYTSVWVDSADRFVVRYKNIQMKKNGLVETFLSSFCALYMFIVQLVMLIINEYTDLILEIT